MQTKNHTVVFYLSWFFEGLIFKCKDLSVQFESKNLGHKLKEDAYRAIKEEYKTFFSYDNFEVHLIMIK